jgi:hypothetical protein
MVDLSLAGGKGTAELSPIALFSHLGLSEFSQLV